VIATRLPSAGEILLDGADGSMPLYCGLGVPVIICRAKHEELLVTNILTSYRFVELYTDSEVRICLEKTTSLAKLETYL
jgi:hypothetical protein